MEHFGVHTVYSVHFSPYSVLVRFFSAADSVCLMNGASFSPLCYMLIFFPLPACCFVVFFALALSWCRIPQGSSTHCVLLASEDRGGGHKRQRPVGDREREQWQLCDPQVFAAATVKWRCVQKAHFSIFLSSWLFLCLVNLRHLMFLSSPNRIGWDGVVFISNLSRLWHLQRIFFTCRSFATSQHLSHQTHPRLLKLKLHPPWMAQFLLHI